MKIYGKGNSISLGVVNEGRGRYKDSKSILRYNFCRYIKHLNRAINTFTWMQVY